jgi:hypothetical protein
MERKEEKGWVLEGDARRVRDGGDQNAIMLEGGSDLYKRRVCKTDVVD